MQVPINLAGGSYKHKSRPLTKQFTRNWWPQAQGTKKARSDYILTSFYGLKLFKANAGSTNRGMIENQGKLYKVTDTTLYEVDINGNHTALGTIPGSYRCIIKPLGSSLVIVNGSGLEYVWNGSTLTLNTSPNIGLPRGVAVLNSQAITDNGSGQQWDVSNAGDPLTINGLNNAAAETYSDDLLIPYAWRDTAYFMGDKSIELWYNSGQGNPPFDKIQGAALQLGLGAIHSVADTEDVMLLFGSDKQVHSITPGTTAVDTVVSTPAMAKEFQTYLITDDAVGWTMKLEGQWFYVLTFPTQDITWVLPIGGEWFEWGSGLAGRIRADSYAFAFGKHLVAEYGTGNIYELDAETYTDANEEIIRTRDSAPIHSGMIGQANKEFEINSISFELETGVGLLTGQGSGPRNAVSVSRDGGKSFGTERFLRAGKLGERLTVTAKSFGRFKSSCVIRVRTSDPIYWTLYSGDIDMEICI